LKSKSSKSGPKKSKISSGSSVSHEIREENRQKNFEKTQTDVPKVPKVSKVVMIPVRAPDVKKAEPVVNTVVNKKSKKKSKYDDKEVVIKDPFGIEENVNIRGVVPHVEIKEPHMHFGESLDTLKKELLADEPFEEMPPPKRFQGFAQEDVEDQEIDLFQDADVEDYVSLVHVTDVTSQDGESYATFEPKEPVPGLEVARIPIPGTNIVPNAPPRPRSKSPKLTKAERHEARRQRKNANRKLRKQAQKESGYKFVDQNILRRQQEAKRAKNREKRRVNRKHEREVDRERRKLIALSGFDPADLSIDFKNVKTKKKRSRPKKLKSTPPAPQPPPLPHSKAEVWDHRAKQKAKKRSEKGETEDS